MSSTKQYILLPSFVAVFCWLAYGMYGSVMRRTFWQNGGLTEMDSHVQSYHENATKSDIWAEYGCDAIVKHRPVPTESIWTMLRTVYQDTVGPINSSIPLAGPITGFSVNHVIKQTQGKGRGVFTVEDIKKGQLVYSGVLQVAEFTTGSQFRRFLRSIPNDLACDAMMWAYVENGEGEEADLEDEYLVIGLDLDEGSLLNDGKVDLTNLGCDKESSEFLPFGCEYNYFALREIKKGEELLVAYADFEAEDGWKVFGL